MNADFFFYPSNTHLHPLRAVRCAVQCSRLCKSVSKNFFFPPKSEEPPASAGKRLAPRLARRQIVACRRQAGRRSDFIKALRHFKARQLIGRQ